MINFHEILKFYIRSIVFDVNIRYYIGVVKLNEFSHLFVLSLSFEETGSMHFLTDTPNPGSGCRHPDTGFILRLRSMIFPNSTRRRARDFVPAHSERTAIPGRLLNRKESRRSSINIS